MRPANYKLDWFIPNQIAALTHFHSDVTAEDFMGVMQRGQELLSNIKDEFHLIIDNRVVAMPSLLSLSQMKQMVSYMNHPLLRWVVVVKSESLDLDATSLPVDKEGETKLKNVSSLSEAIEFLRDTTRGVDWDQADLTFFPNAGLDQ